jgi:hypothetical protein
MPNNETPGSLYYLFFLNLKAGTFTEIMNTSKHIGFCVLSVFGLFLNAYSQRQTLIGIQLNGEIYPGTFRPAMGLTFEKQLTKHSGVETGILFRTEESSGTITYTDASGSQPYSFTVTEQHLNLPVLYKYYSNIINFSAGPMVDFYLGWKQEDDGSPLQIEDYDVDPKVKLGFLAKVSKVITLNKRFVLEPELRFGSVQTLEEAGLGIGIGWKYRF